VKADVPQSAEAVRAKRVVAAINSFFILSSKRFLVVDCVVFVLLLNQEVEKTYKLVKPLQALKIIN
jgi:hypothetical protein